MVAHLSRSIASLCVLALSACIVEPETVETVLLETPERLVTTSTSRFVFHSPSGHDTFRCVIDRLELGKCVSPLELFVKDGDHFFQVAAYSPTLGKDNTPAEWAWTVKTNAQ
jgi:hypothetical protein